MAGLTVIALATPPSLRDPGPRFGQDIVQLGLTHRLDEAIDKKSGGSLRREAPPPN